MFKAFEVVIEQISTAKNSNQDYEQYEVQYQQFKNDCVLTLQSCAIHCADEDVKSVLMAHPNVQ